jgi:DNA gyrase subunit A
VANLLAFQPDEHIAQVLDLRDYQQSPYLVLATKRGLVKKTRLEDYDTNRSAGVIAINLRDEDELVSAQLVSESDDLMLVSRKGQSIRFTATDEALRPMGRATSGVTGMKFREDDELLAADVVQDGSYVFIVTEGGYAKRTAVEEYRLQGRGGLGIKVAKLAEDRGDLVGALIVQEEDEVLVVMEGGKVVRSSVAGVPAKGRDTMGVIFAKPDKNDRIIEVARNSERGLEGDEPAAESEPAGPADGTDNDGANTAETASENPATAPDDVTLAEDAGSRERSAETESVPAPESEESSGNAELDEDNTGGNE